VEFPEALISGVNPRREYARARSLEVRPRCAESVPRDFMQAELFAAAGWVRGGESCIGAGSEYCWKRRL